MKLPHTICYISKSSESLSQEEIAEVLEQAAEANNGCEVNGILLHSLGSFFQVLEGGRDHITALYKKILEDPRHGEVFEVYNRSTAKPVFLGYHSNFHIVTTNEQLYWIREYLKIHHSSTTSDKLARLLRPFAFFD